MNQQSTSDSMDQSITDYSINKYKNKPDECLLGNFVAVYSANSKYVI